MRKITKLLAAFLCLFVISPIFIYANNTFAEQQSTGLLVINVQDGSNYKGIEGAYFQITSQSDASYIKIVKTDDTGRVEINLVPGNYNIKQLGTTTNSENYTFTSIGYSRKIEAGKTVTLTGYERKIEGDYIFGDSPATVHVSTNSDFDPSPLGQGIKASTLNLDGTTSALIPSSQIYSYYNNVDTSVPGEYICIYMAKQSILGVRTTHYLKVIVDPLAPIFAGDVTAKYIDTDGNKISDDVVQTGNIGESYNTEQKSIPGYTFKELQGSTSGIFTDKTQTVTYVYTKDPILGGEVTVRYVDIDGNKIS
ncbi:MucBP domain-containing protein, partial [Lactococcus lactis]|uniref:MucBP domain-containing protein n=1 Tax=Lactococcus lactis TaxID=1358 RepID=UPI00241610D7